MRTRIWLSIVVGPVAVIPAAARADERTPAQRPREVSSDEKLPWWAPFEPSDLQFDAAGLRWRVGAYATVASTYRGRKYVDGGRGSVGATNARPIVEAWDEDFLLRVEGDAIGVDTRRHLYEAWAAWRLSPAARVSVGQFRVALGGEFGTHEQDLPYIGYGFTSHMTGRYDVGARLDGEVTPGLWYQLAGVAGEGFNIEGEQLESPQASFRVAAAPFQIGDEGIAANVLRGFHVGAAYAHQFDGDDPVRATTPLSSVVFRSRPLGGESAQYAAIDLGFTSGPVQFGFEKTMGAVRDADFRGTREGDLDKMSAYSWYVAWNLTGEERGWRDGTWHTGPCPGARQCDFLPAGSWELSGRFSALTAGRDFFDEGLARPRGTIDNPPGNSTWQAHSYSLALFWEASRNVRLGVEAVKTVTEDRMAVFSDSKRDTAFVLQLELKF